MMTKISVLFFCVLSVLTQLSYAQDVSLSNENIVHSENKSAENEKSNIEATSIENQNIQSEEPVIDATPEVGKHVMANMDVGSMIVSLLMVLALIIISAFILKRFNLTQQSSNHLKVVANLSLGAKERIIVVQIGEQQLVLGVCSQQISLLKDLEEPIDVQATKPLALSKNVLSFLHKSTVKTDQNSNVATNETTNNK